MPLEIERRFLVRHDGWQDGTPGTFIRQGYLLSLGGQTLRVRLAGQEAFLTIKAPRIGLVRQEVEHPIPPIYAEMLLRTACLGGQVVKTRHRVHYQGMVWEVDVFHGANTGLVITEVELERPDQPLAIPDWAGAEISSDRRYSNSSLARYPLASYPLRSALAA